MAYDNQGAAIGAAGHYASAITAALITSGALAAEDVLDTFTGLLTDTFAACEALKGEQPAQAAPARSTGGNRGGARRTGSGGGGNVNPGTVDFRGGKYAGQTISSVYDEDPDYLDWCVANLKNDFMVTRIEQFLATVA